MTVLTTHKAWRRPVAVRADLAPDLSEEERAAVRRALVFLRIKLGGGVKLARALRVSEAIVNRAIGKGSRPSAGLALRVARLAGVSVEDVLIGKWPADGACPHCGRF